MNPFERDLAIEQLERAIAVLRTMPVQTPCAQCAFFSPDKLGRGLCTHWNAEVPVEAQPVGCAKWEDGIPF